MIKDKREFHYIFRKVPDDSNKFDCTEIIVKVDTVDRDELLEAFASFLRGCGYAVDGELEIVNDEKEGV